MDNASQIHKALVNLVALQEQISCKDLNKENLGLCEDDFNDLLDVIEVCSEIEAEFSVDLYKARQARREVC